MRSEKRGMLSGPGIGGTLVLDRKTYACSRTLKQYMLEDLPATQIESFMDDVVGDMIVQLRADICAERLAEASYPITVTGYVNVPFPSNPWQHLKERFAPAWFLKRWPVWRDLHRADFERTRHVHVTQFATFPMSPIKMPVKLQGPKVVRYETSSVD